MVQLVAHHTCAHLPHPAPAPSAPSPPPEQVLDNASVARENAAELSVDDMNARRQERLRLCQARRGRGWAAGGRAAGRQLQGRVNLLLAVSQASKCKPLWRALQVVRHVVPLLEAVVAADYPLWRAQGGPAAAPSAPADAAADSASGMLTGPAAGSGDRLGDDGVRLGRASAAAASLGVT